MGIMRDGIEGWEPPLTCYILVDDINWWVVEKDKSLNNALLRNEAFIIALLGKFIKSYHDNITHQTVNQMQNERIRP